MLVGGYSTGAKRTTAVSGAFPGVGRNKMLIVRRLAWVVGKLLPFVQRYITETRVTFGLTNGSGIVGHDRIANLFGTARELFGLSRIPGFAKDAGKKYLLKTCDADYCHEADFRFGDTIKTVIGVAEVNGASFKLQGRFINKRTGKICATALQTIAYTNMMGRPTRLPRWLKILLELSCSQDATEKKAQKEESLGNRNSVFQRQVIVTSEMTNAEKNVNHDEYAKMLTQTIELFLFSRGGDLRARSFKVEDACYKYYRDFFFGERIAIELYAAEIEGNEIIFEASFFNQAGQVHTFGQQRVKFANN